MINIKNLTTASSLFESTKTTQPLNLLPYPLNTKCDCNHQKMDKYNVQFHVLVVLSAKLIEPCNEKTCFFPYAKTKAQIRPQGLKKKSSSTQLSMKFILLINVKMPKTVAF